MAPVKAIGPTVWKYVKYQICHKDYVSEFKEMQAKLECRRKAISEDLQTQLKPGKIAKKEVEAWLKKAGKETVEKVAEDLICKGGCFTYICSSRKLDKKTEALNKGIFKQGEKYTNAGESVVEDDHSIEYCVSVFKEKQEKLKHQKEYIEAILKNQSKQPGKIARKEVEDWIARKEIEDWLEKAGQQIAIKVEDLICLGESSSSANIEGKTEEFKKILEEGKEFTNSLFRSLKFSYEGLEPQCQECFLYCALYPKNYEIPKEELIECWIDEGFMYKEGETRHAMNYEGHVILKKLVDNCMLELVKKKDKESCVTMPDLFREMALDISPQFLVKAGVYLKKLPEEREWREDLLKVSLMKNFMKPSSMPSPKCPMLTTLLLSENMISTIPEAFFEHMLGLKILDLSNNIALCSLPSAVSKLEKLTTLLLRDCWSLRQLPSLSNLVGLKKLDLSETPIEELPQDLNFLTNLRYLCFGERFSTAPYGIGGRLSEIPDGLLQNLSKLQHLQVDNSIPLKAGEIARLGKLEFLRGHFSTVHDMSIFVNSERKFLNMYGLVVGRCNKNSVNFDMKLKTIVCGYIDISGEPNWLPSDVQHLKIDGCKNVRSLNDISGLQDAINLRVVDIYGCDGVEFVLSWPWLNPLQNLEELRLSYLRNLNAVFGEVGAVVKSALLPAGTFHSLKEINVQGCSKIKMLFPLRWLGCLQNLESIEVSGCEKIEEILWSEDEKGEKALEKVFLPKLQRLQLTYLPQLRSIYSGSSTLLICDSIKKIEMWKCESIESVFWSGFDPLPTLEHLELRHLENLKSVFDEEALSLLPTLPPTTFFSLKEIEVSDCHQLKKVFSSGWLLGYFQFLETIRVYNCGQMEELISSSANEEEKVTLPKLQRLKLMGLPTLKSICSSSTVLICDSFESLAIFRCEKLKRIPLNFGLLDNAQSSHPPSLKEIVFDGRVRWESLEWDHPNAKDVLLPFCKFGGVPSW